jgi:hypothetical protein
MTKKILKPIVTSIVQIIVLAIIHNCLNYYYPIQHNSIGFGMTIFLTGITFSLAILAFNFYLEFSRRNVYWIALILFIPVTIFPLEAFNERPLRSLFLITLALSSFLSSLILNKTLPRTHSKSPQRE